MEILLLIILLAIISPGFISFIIIPLLIIIGVILLIQVLFHSVSTIFIVPRSLLWIAFNKRIRQNHALEHATVNVLEEHFGQTSLGGYATKDGFKLRGASNISPELILEAAQTGLSRLRKGEKELALHTRCGSSLLISNFLFSILIIAVLIFMKFFNLFLFIALIIGINLLARPLGRLTQKYITTSPDVENIMITKLDVQQAGSNPFFNVFFREFHVHTEKCTPGNILY